MQDVLRLVHGWGLIRHPGELAAAVLGTFEQAGFSFGRIWRNLPDGALALADHFGPEPTRERIDLSSEPSYVTQLLNQICVPVVYVYVDESWKHEVGLLEEENTHFGFPSLKISPTHDGAWAGGSADGAMPAAFFECILRTPTELTIATSTVSPVSGIITLSAPPATIDPRGVELLILCASMSQGMLMAFENYRHILRHDIVGNALTVAKNAVESYALIFDNLSIAGGKRPHTSLHTVSSLLNDALAQLRYGFDSRATIASENNSSSISVEDVLIGIQELNLGRRFTFHIDDGPVPLLSVEQAAAVRFAISELSSNAFGKDGDADRVVATVSMVGKDSITVLVEDNGKGIAKHKWSGLFSRGSSETTDTSHGWGLPTVRTQLDRIGGTIDLVRSTLGIGTAFQLRVPTRGIVK